MTLSFHKPFLDLDDKPVTGPENQQIMLDKFLSSVLSQDIGGANKDAFKIDSAMRIAKELHQGKVISVTDSEAELLNDAILSSSAIISLKHQLLAVIKETKLSAKPEAEKK